MSESNNDMESGCVCHENREETVAHGCVGHHHGPDLQDTSTAFSCHVVVPDQSVRRTEKIVESIRHELFHRFRFDHPVLQFETSACGNGTLLCEMACSAPSPQDKESGKAGSKGEPAHAR